MVSHALLISSYFSKPFLEHSMFVEDLIDKEVGMWKEGVVRFLFNAYLLR